MTIWRNAVRKIEEDISNVGVPPRGDQVPPLEKVANDDQAPVNAPPFTDENISAILPLLPKHKPPLL